jgi:hypothetical protein
MGSMGNPVVHVEIRSADPDATRSFFGQLFGWTFVEEAIFAAARPHGIHLEAGSCNGQPAFATYAPDTEGRLAVTGLQILQLADTGGQPLITALASYRDPALAIRCGRPAVLQ